MPVPVSGDDVGEVFLRAIKVLEERGWHQGNLVNHSNGSVCIYGALIIATGSIQEWLSDHFFLESIIRSRLVCAVGNPAVGKWNDAPERTYEDVVLALKRGVAGEAAPTAAG